MKKSKLMILISALGILLSATACGNGPSLFASSTTGQINGSITQDTNGMDSNVVVRLMPEKYYTMTLEPDATIEPSEYIEINLDNKEKFVFENVAPGNYYLDVQVIYNPCFLGAPGMIFNGAIVVMMETWTPIGFSFTDGTSLISGRTEVFEVKAGKPMEIMLDTPKCY